MEVKYMTNKSRFKQFQCDHIFPNETLTCVCADLTCIHIIYTKEWKYISLCLNSDYSLITYQHSFVYERAEFLFHFSQLYKYYTFIYNYLLK